MKDDLPSNGVLTLIRPPGVNEEKIGKNLPARKNRNPRLVGPGRKYQKARLPRLDFSNFAGCGICLLQTPIEAQSSGSWLFSESYKGRDQDLFRVEIGKPVPMEDALATNDDILPIGSDQLQEQFRGGGEILMGKNLSFLVDDAEEH